VAAGAVGGMVAKRFATISETAAASSKSPTTTRAINSGRYLEERKAMEGGWKVDGRKGRKEGREGKESEERRRKERREEGTKGGKEGRKGTIQKKGRILKGERGRKEGRKEGRKVTGGEKCKEVRKEGSEEGRK
jgi:hypothetical protein